MYICNVYHDLLIISRNLDDIAILSINDIDFQCFISGINKSEAVKELQNVDFKEKRWTLKNLNFYQYINMNKIYWWNWSWRTKSIDETEVEKHRFYQRKNPVLIYDVDINKKLFSNTVSFGEKGLK